MDDHITQLTASAERLASAAEALSQALSRLDEQQQALNNKVERIVAAISDDDRATPFKEDELRQLREQVAELERINAELKAQAAQSETRVTRKTLPPLVSTLLAKNGMDNLPSSIDAELLDKTLTSLSLEQRIAVKAEMARAGLIG